MKKLGLFFLCLLLFLAVVGGCGAYLYLTPRGILRPDGPDAVMQSVMDGMDRSKWRQEYLRLCPAEVSEFEDAEKITADIFDAAVGDAAFAFRPVPDSESDTAQDCTCCSPWWCWCTWSPPAAQICFWPTWLTTDGTGTPNSGGWTPSAPILGL